MPQNADAPAGRTMGPSPQVVPSGNIGDRELQVADTSADSSSIAVERLRTLNADTGNRGNWRIG